MVVPSELMRLSDGCDEDGMTGVYPAARSLQVALYTRCLGRCRGGDATLRPGAGLLSLVPCPVSLSAKKPNPAVRRRNDGTSRIRSQRCSCR